jgi:signal transduction histidine kinase
VLDDHGLEPALEALAERLRSVSGLTVDLQVELGDESGRKTRLAPQVEDTIYRVVQEALTNVVKHAVANRAHVCVQETDGIVQLSVRDEGEGFAEDAETAGFGLLGMRERLALVDGTVTIDSAAGEGTTVHASIPVNQAFPSGVVALARSA